LLAWNFARIVANAATTMSSSESKWVSVEGPSTGFRQTIEIGRHQLVGDEPVALGGEDGGPNPYDYLLAALGTCTSMTLSMYARKRGWPLEAVRVRLHHAKIHAEDCEQCETKTGMVDHIEREITLIGTLDDTQRTTLLAIADRCPVHKTLKSEIAITSRLA
jgi:putative redox protein